MLPVIKAAKQLVEAAYPVERGSALTPHYWVPGAEFHRLADALERLSNESE